MVDEEIETIPEFIEAIESDYAEWGTAQLPWFRGEPSPGEPQMDVYPLLPKVYRCEYDENALLQFFRKKAPVLDLEFVPNRQATDQWLFLARHLSLPTRLLDWSEGALIALYFALESANEEPPIVWMLDPQKLNRKAARGYEVQPNEPTVTWTGKGNLYYANVKAAWELDQGGTTLPVAIHPTNVHPLMSAQHSCFTIHGQMKEGLAQIAGDCLRVYKIRIDKDQGLLQLRRLGISRSALFPTAKGLAEELEWLREMLPGGERG